MTSSPQYPKDFFSVNKRILRLVGLWSTDEKGVLYHNMYAWLRYTMYAFYFLCEIARVVERSGSTIKVLMVVGATVVHTTGFAKMVTFLVNKAKLKNILETLESNKFKYQPVGNFDPVSTVQRAHKGVYFINAVYFLMTTNTVLFNYFSSVKKFYFTPSDDFILAGGTIKCDDIMALNVRFPFQMDKKVPCGIALLLQLPSLFLSTIEIVVLDTFYLAIVYKIGIHYRMIQGALKSMKMKCLEELNIVQKEGPSHKILVQRRMEFYMKKYSKHLQLLTKLTFEIRDICCYVNLTIVVGNILAVAALLRVSITETTDITGNTKFYLFLISLITQVALYSVPANFLTISCDEISTAFYFCNWLDESASFKKSLIINVIKFQKPVYMTIGKFSPLTLSTFVSVLRASYSFYAVFRKN